MAIALMEDIMEVMVMEVMGMVGSLARDPLRPHLKHIPLLSQKQQLQLSRKPKHSTSISLTAKRVITSPMYTNHTAMWGEDLLSPFLDFSTALAVELL